MISKHYAQDRENREDLIARIGEGRVIKTVVIDKGHIMGKEIHKISSTGIITVYNFNSGLMVTKMIARPEQIRGYFKSWEYIPPNVLRLARIHQTKGYNYV